MRRSASLRASARFFKGEALGNDYLVFEAGDAWDVTPPAVRAVCDRHRGAGADGIIVCIPPLRADYAVRIFNPDGSEAERSGNGLRIFAVAVMQGAVRSPQGPAKQQGPAGALPAVEPPEGTGPGHSELDLAERPAPEGATAGVQVQGARPHEFTVEVGGDTVRISLHDRSPDGTWNVSVDMGCATFHDADVGLDRARMEDDPTVRHLLQGEARASRRRGARRGPADPVLCPVSIGNPHCVVFGTSWDETQLRRIGPALSTHPAFARGVNVQLAWPVGKRRIRTLVWERGAGETSASGSSASAVAAAAVKQGLVDAGPVEVEMPGGTLTVEVGPDFAVTLFGPARGVYRGTLSPAFLAVLSPG